MNSFSQFISTLFHSRTQAHVYHLQTNSYAEHKALEDYYNGIVGLIDGLVESYQGRMGKLEGYSPMVDLREYTDNAAVVTYFSGLALFIEKIRQQVPQDSYLQNQIDEVVALVSSTVYKLRMLS